MGLFYLDIGTEENIVRRVQGITGAIFLLISVGGYNGAGNIAQVRVLSALTSVYMHRGRTPLCVACPC